MKIRVLFALGLVVAILTLSIFWYQGRHKVVPTASVAEKQVHAPAQPALPADPVVTDNAAPAVEAQPAPSAGSGEGPNPSARASALSVIFPEKANEVVTLLKGSKEPLAAMLLKDRLAVVETNGVGEFLEQAVDMNQAVPIAVRFPQGEPGQRVAVTMQDGGKVILDGKKSLTRVVLLDENCIASFLAEISHNNGIHRITVQNGYDVKLLNFWAGEPVQFKDPTQFSQAK